MSLMGCANYTPEHKQSRMIIGGALGRLVGSQVGNNEGRTAPDLMGTLAGAVVGSAVGRSMAEVDRLKIAHTLESVRTGVPTSWKNPDSGHQYVVVLTRTYEALKGPFRDYTVDAVIAGKMQRVLGTACRQQYGSWQVSN